MDIFKNSLFYCFTGAPKFDENIRYDRTTKSIFGDRIDSYSLKDSLIDKNSLNMQVSYFDDEKNKKSYSKKRIRDISENILENFKDLSCDNKFNSILIVDSNQEVIDYYEILKRLNINAVPILRFNRNEEYNGLVLMDYFDDCIDIYSKKFSCDLKSLTNNYEKLTDIYEQNVIEKMKNNEIDLVIMDKSVLTDPFKINILSGLNDYYLNTIYLDAKLDYENLIQVISLANFPYSKKKLYSNIVLFRDIEDDLNNALKLFSDKDSSENYELKNYDYYMDNFKNLLNSFDIDDKNFIDDFNQLSNYYNILLNFREFELPQNYKDEFNAIRTKYSLKLNQIKESMKELDDFNLSNIKKFKINSDYINELSSDSRIQIDEELLNSINDNKFIIKKDIIVHDEEIPSDLENVSKKHVKPKFNIKNGFQVCEKCNILYDSSDTFCKKCGSELKNLSEFDDFKRVCLNCKLLISDDEAVFCKNCGDSHLSNLEDYLFGLTKICPNCKKRHNEEDNFCKVCRTPLTEFKIFKDVNINELDLNPQEYYNQLTYKNNLNSLDEILTEENYDKLSNFKLTEDDYNQIIENIEFTSSKILNDAINDNAIDIDNISPFEKVLLYSKSYTTVEFKSSGASQGVYELNTIKFEERDCASQQISTLIHELSHHILSEIFIHVLMKALDTQKSDDLELFTAYTLGLGEPNVMMDEYCAHTVQGRFVPRDFQEYGSFESIHNKFESENDIKFVSFYMLAGNSFAEDIKQIMEKFIDYDVREEIKEQFKEDIPFLTKTNGYLYEFDDVFETEAKLNFIMATFRSSFKHASENRQIIDELKYK